MRTRSAVLLLVAVLATGCAVVAPSAGPATKPSAPATKASASPKASATPSAKPSAGLATTARKKAPKLPERVNLLLPPALGLVAAGGGNLIGADGATLIGNDAGSLVAAGAGNLISEDGSTMIAAGGGNAKPAGGYLLAQAAGDCPPAVATGAIAFKELVQTNMDVYVENILLVNRVLRLLREADVGADAPYTFDLPDGRGKLTALLRAAADDGEGGVLLVSDGATFDRAKLVIGLTFGSATSGRVVTRPTDVDEAYGQVAFATTFDLATGSATADGAGHKTEDPAARIRAHWEFRAARGQDVGPAFSVHMAANFQFPTFPCESGARAMSIHYAADGRGTARMGRVEPGKADLTYTRRDGQGYAAEAAPETAFFIDTQGSPAEAPAAEDALWSIVPGVVDIYRPFPAAPDPLDPLADPIFAFPE